MDQSVGRSISLDGSTFQHNKIVDVSSGVSFPAQSAPVAQEQFSILPVKENTHSASGVKLMTATLCDLHERFQNYHHFDWRFVSFVQHLGEGYIVSISLWTPPLWAVGIYI